MTSDLPTIQFCGLAAVAFGITTGFLFRRAPKRGWVGVLLLLVASLAWSRIDSGETAEPSSLGMTVTFLALSPIAVIYSFRARRNAPDKLFASAAFIGSFVVGAFLLFMIAGIAASFILPLFL